MKSLEDTEGKKDTRKNKLISLILADRQYRLNLKFQKESDHSDVWKKTLKEKRRTFPDSQGLILFQISSA